MKAITLYQPWASLLTCGAKKYETRSWKTSYRGPIAIHAGLRNPLKTMDNAPFEIWDAMLKALCIESFYNWNDAPLGMVIATAELIECWEMHGTHGRGSLYKDIFIDRFNANDPDGVTWIDENEMLFGDWTPGRYAWEFRNMEMLPKPIPAKGHQRLWVWVGESKCEI